MAADFVLNYKNKYTMFLWTAFIVGLVGSAHCAGMCGPIALALPLKSDSWITRVSGGLVYNVGRIFT
jgi:hypothetical protein